MYKSNRYLTNKNGKTIKRRYSLRVAIALTNNFVEQGYAAVKFETFDNKIYPNDG